ncbi:sodium-dependent high-affinity dicarboxylate transporter 2-like isoform X2 [Dermacentor albipictus]|uniref:sodium-dependent high-affinity dicarboxylate transporter 2-like isoform X2 n=1 Tax=Dermacentor albipictus TaxID=60249 RepID=UPI0031FC4F04
MLGQSPLVGVSHSRRQASKQPSKLPRAAISGRSIGPKGRMSMQADSSQQPAVVVVARENEPGQGGVWNTQRMLLGYVSPFMLAPLLVLRTEISKCIYMVLLMSMMWLSMVLPQAATALLPLLVIPVMGIARSKDVAALYYNDAVLSLICSAAFAVTLDRSRLLRRVALMLLANAGLVYRPTTLATLVCTSSVALAALARPTLAVTIMSAAARALVLELQRSSVLKYSRPLLPPMPGEDAKAEKEDPEMRLQIADFCVQLRALLMLVSFGSHLGSFLLPSGSESLIGFNRILGSHLDAKSAPSAFFWLVANGPCVLVLLALNVAYVHFFYLRRLRIYTSDTLRQRRELRVVLRVQHRNESWISPWEGIMAFFFLVFVLILFTREPVFFPGWTSFLSVQRDVGDATPTALVFFLLAFMPVQALEMASKDRALHWKSVLPHIPWGLGLVLASGNAIAFAAKKCGLTDSLLEWGRRGRSPFTYQTLLTVGAAVLAQVVPGHIDDMRMHRLLETAYMDRVPPLYYAWPVSTASCLSFVLPSASSANIMVYHYSDLLFTDMVIPSLLNLVASVVTCLCWYQVVFSGTFIPTTMPNLPLNKTHAILYIDH